MQDNHISDPRTRRFVAALRLRAGRRPGLEWTTAATLPAGKPVEYSGVTVLDLAPDAVARLRTYYDTAVFVTASP